MIGAVEQRAGRRVRWTGDGGGLGGRHGRGAESLRRARGPGHWMRVGVCEQNTQRGAGGDAKGAEMAEGGATSGGGGKRASATGTADGGRQEGEMKNKTCLLLFAVLWAREVALHGTDLWFIHLQKR